MLTPELFSKQSTDPMTDSVVRFIHEWSIFRKQQSAYPAGHPILSQSGERTSAHLTPLFQQQKQIDFGVLKQDLVFNKVSLGEKTPQVKPLAEALYTLGVAVFSIQMGVHWEELVRFGKLLGQTPDEVEAIGGLHKAAARFDLQHIELIPIDFSILQTRESKRVNVPDSPQEQGFWRQFVEGMLDNTIGTGGPNAATENDLTPKSYADMLNRRFGQEESTDLPESGLAELFPSLVAATSGPTSDKGQSHERLLAFVRHLHPDVRRQFLEGGIAVLGDNADFVEELIADLPPAMVDELIDAEERLNAKGKEPPLLKMLQQLGAENVAASHSQPVTVSSASMSALRTIFREDESELFLPKAYQQQLDNIIEGAPLQQISPVLLRNLLDTLEPKYTDPKVCAIILEVVKTLPREQQPDFLAQHLGDISRYFLDLGDFNALFALQRRLRSDLESHADESTAMQQKALSIFEEPDFIEDVLDSLKVWGKSKYAEVQRLIVAVGTPFIDPLIDALAEEESLSLRRYFMECLGKIGHKIRPYLLARLEDPRWYLLRNIIVLLRALKKPDILDPIEALLKHSHLRVRQEVLRTFLQFNDNRGLRALQNELNSQDDDEQLSAIRLAEMMKSPVIVRQLTNLLSTKDLHDAGLKKQLAIIQALGKIGHPEALTPLKQILDSRSLFRVAAQNQLKTEICRNLSQFPASNVRGLLQKQANSRVDSVAQAARASLKVLQEAKE